MLALRDSDRGRTTLSPRYYPELGKCLSERHSTPDPGIEGIRGVELSNAMYLSTWLMRGLTYL